jgi:hypothetical protein
MYNNCFFMNNLNQEKQFHNLKLIFIKFSAILMKISALFFIKFKKLICIFSTFLLLVFYHKEFLKNYLIHNIFRLILFLVKCILKFVYLELIYVQHIIFKT